LAPSSCTMFRQTITLFAVLSLQALTAYAAPSVGDVTVDACAKFTVGDCYKNKTTSDEFPFETFKPEHTTDGSECQEFCDIIYKKFCKFYIYDRRQNLCTLWNVDSDKYLNTCKLHGGPKSTKQDACETKAKDPKNPKCIDFTNEMCIYEGQILETFRYIDDESTCQDICDYSEICKYYVYDSENKECETYDKDSFNCDMVKVKAGAGKYKSGTTCYANDDAAPTPVPITTKAKP